MKSASAALQNHFGLSCTTLAVLWKVVRKDGVTLGFTTHDADIVYGGVTYAAATGFAPSANATSSDMSVDNMEVTGFLDSSAIDEADIRAHLYDNASIEMRIVNWADLTMGDLKVRTGTTGILKMANGLFTAEIRGLNQKLSTIIGATYGPVCRAELGSGADPTIDPGNHYQCGVDLSLYRQNGSVGSSPDAMTIVPAAGLLKKGSATPLAAAPAIWFNDGVLTFTSGAMNGFSVEIKGWDGATLTMFVPLEFAVVPGDTFSIEPGCNKLAGAAGDCFHKFNNIVNFRGESFIPGPDLLLAYPDAHTT